MNDSKILRRDYRQTWGEGYNDAYGNELEPEIPVTTHI